MTPRLLGRTNATFPPIWLRLLASGPPPVTHDEDVTHEHDPDAWITELGEAAVSALTVLDISSQPALWGAALRGKDTKLMTVSPVDLEKAVDASQAGEIIQAHLLQTLSALGRERIDFYFLRVRRALEEYQIEGALECLEVNRQQGHVGFVGIYADGPPLAVLSVWQFHDAFDVVMMPRNPLHAEPYEVLAPLARERRVGVVTCGALDWGRGVAFCDIPSEWRLRNLTQSFYGLTLPQFVLADGCATHPVLVGVRTPGEIAAAVAAADAKIPDGLSAMLAPFVAAYQDPANWVALQEDPRSWVRAAAGRALAGR